MQYLFKAKMPVNCDDDIVLWNSLREGSKQSFQQIYNTYVDDLYYYAILIFKDKVIVEDAIQDVFLNIWKRRSFLGETASIKFYLRKALKRNIARKLATKERLSFRHQIPQDYIAEFIDSPETITINRQMADQTSEVLIKTIKTLPIKQREILMYKFYDNLTPREISNVMSISLDSVYTLASRALKELKSRLRTHALR